MLGKGPVCLSPDPSSHLHAMSCSFSNCVEDSIKKVKELGRRHYQNKGIGRLRNYLPLFLALAMFLSVDQVTLGYRNTMMRLLVICRNCLAGLVPVHQEPSSAAIALRHLHHLGLLAQVMSSLTGTTMTNLQDCSHACTHGCTHTDTHTGYAPYQMVLLPLWLCYLIVQLHSVHFGLKPGV